MTPEECAAIIRAQAAACGMTVQEFSDSINHATREDIEAALEACPTDVLEWAVKFEALANRSDSEDGTA